jgi:hypothetical protein
MSGGNDLTMSGGNDLTMSGGNDLTMSGGGCSKPSDGNAYAGFEQLIDDPIIANELGSYKSLFDMFRVGEFEPPERLLGKYILETSTCTSIKKVMKKELTNKIVTHYNEKREDFEQYLKVKIQTYVDKNIPTELKKGYDDALVKANGESKEKEEGEGKVVKPNPETLALSDVPIGGLESQSGSIDGTDSDFNNSNPNPNPNPKPKPPPPPIPRFDPEKLYKDHTGGIVKYINEIRNTDDQLKYKFYKPNHGYIIYSLPDASKFKEYNPNKKSKSFNQKFTPFLNNDTDGITSDEEKLMITDP